MQVKPDRSFSCDQDKNVHGHATGVNFCIVVPGNLLSTPKGPEKVARRMDCRRY